MIRVHRLIIVLLLAPSSALPVMAQQPVQDSKEQSAQVASKLATLRTLAQKVQNELEKVKKEQCDPFWSFYNKGDDKLIKQYCEFSLPAERADETRRMFRSSMALRRVELSSWTDRNMAINKENL